MGLLEVLHNDIFSLGLLFDFVEIGEQLSLLGEPLWQLVPTTDEIIELFYGKKYLILWQGFSLLFLTDTVLDIIGNRRKFFDRINFPILCITAEGQMCQQFTHMLIQVIFLPTEPNGRFLHSQESITYDRLRIGF